MKKIHLWPEDTTEQAGFITIGFTLEKANNERIPVWFRFPSEYRQYVTKGCEPFVLASLFTAMRSPADLIVHGEVSPVLLRNLEEVQAAWSLWFPRLYTPIEIQADAEREQTKPDKNITLMTFSGGVDSCFTAWRHRMKKGGRRNQDLQTGLFLHGYDIPLGREETFERAKNKARILTDSIGMDLIPMAVNIKTLGDNFAHNNGAFLASCMMVLQGKYVTGLISGGASYVDVYIPWGSNAITDPFLSSGVFNIIYDSTDFPRNRKIQEIAQWSEANQYLRVCLGENRNLRDRNCCRCEKCIRTILNFRALGLGLPACFAQDASFGDIARLSFEDVKFLKYYQSILEDAKASRVNGMWVNAVRLMVFANRLRNIGAGSPFIRRLHKTFYSHNRNYS